MSYCLQLTNRVMKKLKQHGFDYYWSCNGQEKWDKLGHKL